MTVLVVTGRAGKSAADTARRDAARAQELAQHIDDLVVLDADETGLTPVGARDGEVSWRRDQLAYHLDVRRPGSVVLLLDVDLDQVKLLHPLARKLDVPLLWWHEDPLSDPVVGAVRQSIAGLLTMWDGRARIPGWLWSVGAGIDLQVVQAIESFPARPPLRLLAWVTGSPDLSGTLRALAFARALNADAHLTVALTDPGSSGGQRHQIEAQIRNLALTQSADVAVVDGPERFRGMLAEAHALVDVEGPDDGLGLAALLAMAHARPVLSSREQFRTLLETAPLPLWFAAGDERQLAESMKSLAAGWSEELDSIGQALRTAVRQEHSVGHWAEAVASIVGVVSAQRQTRSEPARRLGTE
jgi:hypothetical protein